MTWKPKGNMVQPLVTGIFLLIAQGSEETLVIVLPKLEPSIGYFLWSPGVNC